MSSTNEEDVPSSVSPSEYGKFIGQIELLSIWLARAEVENRAGPEPPARGKFSIEDDSTWAPQPGVGFVVNDRYTVELHGETSLAMSVKAEYAVLYRSSTPLTDELFQVFKRVNLPLNVWPYLREYVSSTMGRFGWPPFTLPAFKVNTPRDNQDGSAEPAKKGRRAVGKTRVLTEPVSRE